MAIKFDHTTDYSGKELFSFLHNVSVPEFIKQADVSGESDTPLKKEAYADQSFRAFPINTAENTFLSYVHFFNKKAAIAHEYGDSHVKAIEQKIKVAADIFEITPHIETYAKEQKSKLSKTASAKDIGFVKVGSSILPTYSFTSAEDLVKVAETFVEDISMFSFADRLGIAGEIVKSAIEEGVDEVPDKVAKYAGYGFIDRGAVANELFRRKAKFKTDAEKQKVDKIAEAFKSSDVGEQLKAAQALHELETEAGFYFNDKLANVLGDFVDHVFMTAEKVASIIDDVIYLGKEAFEKSELTKVSADVYKQAFDLDIDPAKIAEYKDELATMPASDVSLFRTLAKI